MAAPTFSGEEWLVRPHGDHEREEEEEEGGEGSLHVAPHPGALEPGGASRDLSVVSQALQVGPTKHWKSDQIFHQYIILVVYYPDKLSQNLNKTRRGRMISSRFRCCRRQICW